MLQFESPRVAEMAQNMLSSLHDTLSNFANSDLAFVFGCAGRRIASTVPQPRIISHREWQTQPPLGYAADATRRNTGAGDSLAFRGLIVSVLETSVDSTTPKPTDVVRLRLASARQVTCAQRERDRHSTGMDFTSRS